MLSGIIVLVIVQGLLLLPAGFEWLDGITGIEVDTESTPRGFPYYHYGQFVRYVEL